MDAGAILARCQKDPLFFSRHVLGGDRPWRRQEEIIRSVRDRPRTVVPSGFAVGKTWVAAVIVLWFLYSFPSSLVITTGPTWRQVKNVLWAEIRRLWRQAATPLGGELLETQIRIADDWFALGMSTDDPTRFQGFHAAHLLLIFDEAAGVDRQVWEVAEGQMAGAHARWLAIGNPTEPSGPFYDACCSESWHTLPISCLDTPNVKAGRLVYPKLVTKAWVEGRRQEWGDSSPLYQTKVLGQFPTQSEHGLIPLVWISAANDRAAMGGEGSAGDPAERRIGADIARSGADATVFLLRDDRRVLDVEEHQSLNTMEVVGRLTMFAERHKVPWHRVFVDSIGIGAGVADRLCEQDRRVRAVNFGRSACHGKRYANVRAECYWGVQEALDPGRAAPLAIPARFGRLCSELTSVEWSVNSSGAILVEPKEQIKQRIGRSPDHADALALTFASTRQGRPGKVLSVG